MISPPQRGNTSRIPELVVEPRGRISSNYKSVKVRGEYLELECYVLVIPDLTIRVDPLGYPRTFPV